MSDELLLFHQILGNKLRARRPERQQILFVILFSHFTHYSLSPVSTLARYIVHSILY